MSEQLGRDLRAFLQGFMSTEAEAGSMESVAPMLTPAAISTVQARLAGASSSRPGANASSGIPDLTQITMLPNSAARLPRGHLVLGAQANNSGYRLDPETGEIEVLFQLSNTLAFLWRVIPTKSGLLYASLSGTRPPGGGNLQWGLRGIVFSIDLVREIISPVPGFERLIDPVDIIVLDDGKLLIVDFMGFNGQGAVYLLDPSTSDTQKLDLGNALHDPNCAYLDDDGVLFVANPWQNYQNRRGADGLPLKDYGNVIMVDPVTKKIETIYDNSTTPEGAIVGVTGTPDKKSIIVVRTDWPVLSSSAILRIDRSTKKAVPLIEASDASRRFFSPRCAVIGDLLYAADSYQRQLLAIDIKSGKIAKSFDLRAIIPGGTGIVASTQSIESVAAIP
jgi:hypothetical protein